ncbi:hypothetical protein GCM10010442_12850 [Kitasatospora kifunensis]
MSDSLDSLNALLPADLHFEWVAAEPLPGAAVDRATRERRERFARETRLYWSGCPDPMTRGLLRTYGLAAAQLGLVPRSAFTAEYRRRQRARVKRRRR